ncbi:MAG: peptidoglycan-associated lipoprotein Pal [Pseudomonadota bacterium]
MFKQVALALAVTAFIAGCSSPVKLEDKPPVSDAGLGNNGAGSNGIGTSNVPQVSVDPMASKQGPVGVERLVYFDYDSYTIKPEFQQLLDAHARFLKSDPNRRVNLEGHTDERGGHEYNLALGQKRSEAVRRALGLLGVPDSQMEAVSFGMEKPADPGHDEAAYAKNRRVEITYR